ncbi:uncharacterized protein TRIADDRAFT_58535 [Trichoplax adhaerens]|uniref:E3 ubiquitin-protein ligase MARCHF5 n=1 Tax=Trichoplax adhaerens TaxID=10228 RepID=B3S2Z0_TRIAD|nr:hypothetical protein TRIADDRAFT_58535 [Trichoplax adhaerens]EDV22703.1 hypothetical protein TRIADDRAFT_58535 [Trichoplax adhaerens]|eukprot:XP_002114569.1 hypothetical protein TRIADDRAFT_58535 [Trichoplax adhaerens]
MIYRRLSEIIKRTCWICFGDEDDDLEAEWTHPCNCKGTSAWVHQACLQRWIDEKQNGVADFAVSCPQCGIEYIIAYPQRGFLMKLLDAGEKVTDALSPYITVTILLGSLYWSAVSYGAVTMVQVLGHNDGWNLIEKSDRLPLVIGLPAIPLILVLYKTVAWEDRCLRWIRQTSHKYSVATPEDRPQRVPAEPTHSTDLSSLSRIICGALALPTIAVTCGNLFYGNYSLSNWQKALMGGATYVILRGAVKMYYKQQQYVQQACRKILNYPVD